MKKLNILLCILIGIIKLIILRFQFKKIMLVDFDFTLVNDHFDKSKKCYIEEHQNFNKEILKIMSKHKKYCKVIFTARGLRSVNYIRRNSNWNKYFHDLTFFGSTEAKIFVVNNLISLIFKKIISISFGSSKHHNL